MEHLFDVQACLWLSSRSKEQWNIWLRLTRMSSHTSISWDQNITKCFSRIISCWNLQLKMSLKGSIFKISKSGVYFKQESNPPKLKNVWEQVVSILGFGRPTTHFFVTKMNKSGQATIMNFSFFPHRPFADQFVCQKYDNVMEFMCDMQYVWLSSLQLISPLYHQLHLPLINNLYTTQITQLLSIIWFPQATYLLFLSIFPISCKAFRLRVIELKLWLVHK